MVLGLPKAYRRNTSFKPRIFYYANHGYKNQEAIVNTPETNNRLHAIQKNRVFSVENKRKKKSIGAEQLIFIPHTK